MTKDDDDRKWDAETVRAVLMNPFHTMDPSPVIDDATWVAAQKKLLAELGADRYFVTFLALFKATISEISEA